MRFDLIDIPAFGPFTDFSLDLPATNHDIHLIYGANEAGKSSLLRAIRHLFFGIPTRTPDNFLHPNPRLLVGAAISQDGERLEFFRKKGAKNTLLDGEKNTLDETALKPFLGAVNEEFFEHMFGLDTKSLRAGAAKLLSGEGDLGTAIFSASLGGSPIDDAVKSLEAEANSLCKGNSRKDTTILPAIAVFKEAERTAKAESTSAAAWRFLKTEIRTTNEAFTTRDGDLREHRKRWTFVDNALQAIPVLRTIRELEASLKELAVPELPSDFPVRVRRLQNDLVRSQQALQLQESQIEASERNFSEIRDFAPVLERTADLDTLHRRAEKFLEDRDALPDLQSRVQTLNDQIDGEGDLEKYPPVRPVDLANVREGSDEIRDLGDRSGEVARALKNLEVELKTHHEQLSRLGDATDLDELEEQCRTFDDFAVQHQSLAGFEKKIAILAKEQNELRSRLDLEGDPSGLKVAGPKVIQGEESQRSQIVEKIRVLENRLADVRDALTEEKTNLSHLASQAAIYSLSDLGQEREKRDALWEKICESEVIDRTLGETIRTADIVADALREDADHIAKAAGHQAKIAVLEAKRKDLEADLATANSELTDWTEAWDSKYAISPGQTPAALLEWREDWQKLCECLRESSVLEIEIKAIRDKEDRLLGDLEGSDFGRSHRTLKTDLKKAAQEQGELRAIRKLVSKDEIKREQLEGESVGLAAKSDVSRAKWKEVCESAGLPGGLAPAAALEVLAERSRIRDGILKLRELEQEFHSKKIFVKDYEALLKETADKLKCEASEAALHALYEQAVRDQNRAQTLLSQLETSRETLPALGLEHGSHLAILATMVEQAGSEDLENIIARIERRGSLMARLEEQQTIFGNLAGAAEGEEFTAVLEGLEPENLAEEKATLEEREESLQKDRDAAKAELDGHLRRQGELMNASDLAAVHQQAAADALSTIVADTGRFRQLHYAIDFLKQQIEDYRRKTQGPMIEKTSAFFNRLTDGSFEKVAAQLDDKGVPQLIAIRNGGEAVGTTGLSEGTADQLYLALRLAAIDLHLENHPAIPLILDDLLMTFDDERTKALLPVLQEMSKKTQVLIFTHHEHLKDLVGMEISVHDLAATRSRQAPIC